MNRNALLAALCFAATGSAVHADQQFPALLEGHAFLPAATFVPPPKGAPANLSISGRFLHADMRRRDRIGSIPGIAFLSDPKAPRPTGMDAPFRGQPVQGFSGIKWRKDGTAWVPSDNGYGSKVLEGPLWNSESKLWESRDGKETARILEFDVQQGAYTGRSFRYQLELAGNNIGDFNMIDRDTALVIERDNGEGDPQFACNGPARADCFNVPARFKRVYKIDLSNTDANGFVRKIGYIDLMNIADPANRARIGGGGGRFSFPQWCIEGVDIVDADHIVVVNDNNLTVAQSREFGRNEPNEMILLKVTELLNAK